MDAAELTACGWSALRPDDKATILTKLRALNAARGGEEVAGT